ncbi:MAG TPA: Crp/Fnr family transcriptional regulator [Solirubrobacterales bacterium]|nr:Crp/Fnr family transcriptional regulator [Solirubrobacterales bacterium]
MSTAALLRLDPDLGAGIPASQRAKAVRACRAEVLELPEGRWQEDDADFDNSGFGLIVLSGVLCRRVAQSESQGAEIVGPGDLLRPWDHLAEWSTIPIEASWEVIQPSRLALLDSDFARRAAPYPQVAAQLVRRALIRSRYLAILVAIIGQRRVETRLTMLFWHLADRFGQMSGEWVDIPVPLTHSTLAELVAARRPSVTTALSNLQDQGVVLRTHSGWRLSGTVPPDLLEVQARS